MRGSPAQAKSTVTSDAIGIPNLAVNHACSNSENIPDAIVLVLCHHRDGSLLHRVGSAERPWDGVPQEDQSNVSGIQGGRVGATARAGLPVRTRDNLPGCSRPVATMDFFSGELRRT